MTLTIDETNIILGCLDFWLKYNVPEEKESVQVLIKKLENYLEEVIINIPIDRIQLSLAYKEKMKEIIFNGFMYAYSKSTKKTSIADLRCLISYWFENNFLPELNKHWLTDEK